MMITRNFIGVLALCLCALAACTSSKESKKTLTVLSWNVWHGGHSKTYSGKGCEGTIDILKKSEADVVLMIETYGAAPMVADSLGYSYNLISDNLSIYSRYPIIRKYAFADSISTFNFGGVMIDVDGKPVRVFNTWLHYLPDMRLVPTDKSKEEILAWEMEGTRDEEIHKILSVLQPLLAEADSIPIIMGGDFNVHSHLDWTEATRNLYFHGGAVVDWPVSIAMEEAGFKDSFREMNPNPVANLGVTWLTDADSL